MLSSNDINSAFGDQWGLLFTVLHGLGLVLYGLGLPYAFLFLLLYGLGLVLYGLGLPYAFLSRYTVWDWFCTDWDCLMLSFLVTIRFGTAFLIEYYTDFGLVLSQVRSVPQLYLRSFEVEEKP